MPIKVTEILPRIKDGGAFVKFSHPDSVTSQEVEGLIIKYLKEKYVRPWFNPLRPILHVARMYEGTELN